MKKLLQSSIVLFLFSSSMFLFEISCKKEVSAKITSPTSMNKVAYLRHVTGSSGGGELWIMNIDGTNKTQIPVTPPSGYYISDDLSVSPDGTKLIFSMYSGTAPEVFAGLWSVNTDGSNLVRIQNESGVDIWGFDAF